MGTANFQTSVAVDPAPAVEGDFASANPRATLLAGTAALTAAAAGVIVGRFARALNTDGTVTNGDPGAPSRLAFVHRDQPAIITGFLVGSTLVVPEGQPLALFDSGDFWARFSAGASIGQKVYANNADGSASAAATATPPQGAEVTVTTVNASTSITVTAVVSGALSLGDVLTGTDIPAGAHIVAFGTGTGGVGTYTLSAAATGSASGTDVTATGAKETQWYVHSTAAAGELAKISTRPTT